MGCKPLEPLWNTAKVTEMPLKVQSLCRMKTQKLCCKITFLNTRTVYNGSLGKRTEKQPLKAQNHQRNRNLRFQEKKLDKF